MGAIQSRATALKVDRDVTLEVGGNEEPRDRLQFVIEQLRQLTKYY